MVPPAHRYAGERLHMCACISTRSVADTTAPHPHHLHMLRHCFFWKMGILIMFFLTVSPMCSSNSTGEGKGPCGDTDGLSLSAPSPAPHGEEELFRKYPNSAGS
jgi:hypothetical protein